MTAEHATTSQGKATRARAEPDHQRHGEWGQRGPGAGSVSIPRRRRGRDHGLRRREPRDDFLTVAIATTVGDRPISDEALCSWLGGAVFAGHETTLMAGAGQINDLARDPALQQRLRAQPELILRAVEESLRVNSPVQRFFRTVTEDVELQGVTMRAGDKVMLVYAAANIDPVHFPEPLVVDVERDFTRHLGFGWGVHRCVGAPLALHELRVLTEVMLRTGEFSPSGEPLFSAPRARGSFLGLDSLPLSMVAFDLWRP